MDIHTVAKGLSVILYLIGVGFGCFRKWDIGTFFIVCAIYGWI